MRMTLWLIGAVLLTAVTLAACGGDDADDIADVTTGVTETGSAVATGEELLEDALTVDLEEQNGSGVSGTATLTPVDLDQVEVTLELSGGEEGVAQPAHIHPGTCDDLDPTPEFPLTNVEDGTSETTVQASPVDLFTGEYAINVHKSEDEAETYVACGDIPSASR